MKIKQSIISVTAVLSVAITAVAGGGKSFSLQGRKVTDTTRTDSSIKQEGTVPENSIIAYAGISRGNQFRFEPRLRNS